MAISRVGDSTVSEVVVVVQWWVDGGVQVVQHGCRGVDVVMTDAIVEFTFHQTEQTSSTCLMQQHAAMEVACE